MTVLSFVVVGLPQPAGSKRAFPIRQGGVVVRSVVVDANRKSVGWKQEVARAAAEARGERPLFVGPLELSLRFTMPRPQGHFGSGRNAGQVRAGAPSHPAVKPDLLKLTRAIEDALTGVVYRDDAQIVVEHLEKVYGDAAQTVITVSSVEAAATSNGPARAREDLVGAAPLFEGLGR